MAGRDERVTVAPEKQGRHTDGRQVGANVIGEQPRSGDEDRQRPRANRVVGKAGQEEGACPYQRRRERHDGADRRPARNAGRCDEDEPIDRLRVAKGEAYGQQAAQRVAHVRRRAQVGEPLRDPVDEVVRIVGVPPRKVDEMDGVRERERRRNVTPPSRRAGQAVHEHDRRSRSERLHAHDRTLPEATV